MTTHEGIDYATILSTVRGWSAVERLALVQGILTTLTRDVEDAAERRDTANPARRNTLDQAIGLLKTAAPPSERGRTFESALGLAATDKPPPTDAEVKQWLEERRIEKFG